MLAMVLGLTGELFAGTKKIKNNTDLSDYVTDGTFSDDIKFEKDNKTLFIDGNVNDVTLAGEIHVKAGKAGNTIEAESDFAGTVSLSADNEYNQNITLRGGTIAIIGSGKLGNVALDVLPQEPPDFSHSLICAWQKDEAWLNGRMIINPHSAFFSKRAFCEMRQNAALNAKRIIDGEEPLNIIRR